MNWEVIAIVLFWIAALGEIAYVSHEYFRLRDRIVTSNKRGTDDHVRAL